MLYQNVDLRIYTRMSESSYATKKQKRKNRAEGAGLEKKVEAEGMT